MKRIIILVVFTICTFPVHSQNWTNIGTGTDDVITCLFNDTINHKLCIAGQFTTINGQHARGIATWDGTQFDSMSVGVNYMYGSSPLAIKSMCNYQGKLYVGGLTQKLGYVQAHGIGTWNGSIWDSLPETITGSVYGLEVNGGYLYACGYIINAGGIPVNAVAKWDGTHWSNIGAGFPYINFGTPSLNCIKFYNSELYAGGLFQDSTGNSMNIAKFDGTNWKNAGINIKGSISDVSCMEVYNSELYIGGLFTTADGNLDNGIMRYDGTHWKPVGGGFWAGAKVSQLKVINSELYAVGVFYTAGGVPVYNIAQWNDTDWCSLGSYINGGVYGIADYNNEIYIGGGFDSIDVIGDPYYAMIAKWIGGTYVDSCGHLTTGINELANNNETLDIYPNPATDQITLEFELNETKNVSIEIKNVLGQTIYSETTGNIIGKQSKNIDVSAFSNGIYVVQLKDNNTITNKKFIKN